MGAKCRIAFLDRLFSIGKAAIQILMVSTARHKIKNLSSSLYGTEMLWPYRNGRIFVVRTSSNDFIFAKAIYYGIIWNYILQ